MPVYRTAAATFATQTFAPGDSGARPDAANEAGDGFFQPVPPTGGVAPTPFRLIYGAMPDVITVDMELLSTAATGLALTATETLGAGLLSAAATVQAPTGAETAGMALQGAGAAPQAPSASETAGMPLLSGGPGTQAPTPGAALSVPLQTMQLQLFDPTVLTPWLVDVPLLETLAILLPVSAELQLPPPISRGRARGPFEPTAEPRTITLELLGIRAELPPIEGRIWTVLERAGVEARLELLEPEVGFTWPGTLLQDEDNALLEEDLVGIGI